MMETKPARNPSGTLVLHRFEGTLKHFCIGFNNNNNNNKLRLHGESHCLRERLTCQLVKDPHLYSPNRARPRMPAWALHKSKHAELLSPVLRSVCSFEQAQRPNRHERPARYKALRLRLQASGCECQVSETDDRKTDDYDRFSDLSSAMTDDASWSSRRKEPTREGNERATIDAIRRVDAVLDQVKHCKR